MRQYKPLKTTTLQLEHFDVEKNKWVPACGINLNIEEEPFSSGAFRDAFKATCSDAGLSGGRVKKYQATSVNTITDFLKSTVEIILVNKYRCTPETSRGDFHQEYLPLLVIPSVTVRCFTPL